MSDAYIFPIVKIISDFLIIRLFAQYVMDAFA